MADDGGRVDCIFSLIRTRRNASDYKFLIARDAHLRRFVSSSASLLLFHEGNLPLQHQSAVRGGSLAPDLLHFLNISDDWFAPFTAPPLRSREVGYIRMCRFFGGRVWAHLERHRCEFAMRIDEDVTIDSRLPFDLFDKMRREQLIYAYMKRQLDSHGPTNRTLVPWVRDYFAPHPSPNAMEHYYNNLHVSALAFWRQPRVVAFLRAIEDSEGYVRYRWGDSNVQTVAVRAFSALARRTVLTGFTYTHGSHRLTNKGATRTSWHHWHDSNELCAGCVPASATTGDTRDGSR